MTHELKSVFDGAKLVKFSDNGYFAGVWHGSHTVNFYRTFEHGSLEAIDTSSIGDFETGEVSRSEAESAILSRFEEYRG